MGTILSVVLEGTACYVGLLLAPAEGFSQGLFLCRFAHFRSLVVTLVSLKKIRGSSSSSCGGLWPRLFFALRAKKGLFMSVFGQILVIFGDQ